MQMSQGQTAPPLTRVRGNYPLLSLIFYRGWESVFPLPPSIRTQDSQAAEA